MEPQPTRRVVTVYPITGKQLFFRVPHSWCEECHLSIRAVEHVAADLDHVEVRVRPWFNNLVAALRRGGWHAPVVTIDGKIFSQGIVPDEAELRAALSDPADECHPVAAKPNLSPTDGSNPTTE